MNTRQKVLASVLRTFGESTGMISKPDFFTELFRQPNQLRPEEKAAIMIDDALANCAKRVANYPTNRKFKAIIKEL